MRNLSRYALASLLLLNALAAVSCRSSEQTKGQPESPPTGGPALSEPGENSGETLSGLFKVVAFNDEYSHQERPERAITRISFEPGGRFTLQGFVKGNVQVEEEGSYLIDRDQRLNLYVEKINGDGLDAARNEQFKIVEKTDRRVRLKAGAAIEIVLEKSE